MTKRSDLSDLTLTTGHELLVPRDWLWADTRAWLAPLVAAGGGPIDGIGGYLDMLDVGIPGAAAYQVAPGAAPMSVTPLMMAVVCWDDAANDRAWRLALDQQAALVLPLPAGIRRPPVPWLARSLSPHIAVDDPERLYGIGTLGWCVAWTLIG